MQGTTVDYLIRGALCVVIGVFGALTATKQSHALFSFDSFAIFSMTWFFFLHASSPWGWDCPDTDQGHCRAEGWYPIDIMTQIPVAWMWMSHLSQPFPVLNVLVFFWSLGQSVAQLATFQWRPIRSWTFSDGIGSPNWPVALGFASADMFLFLVCMAGVISGRQKKAGPKYKRLGQDEDGSMALPADTVENCCFNPLAYCCRGETTKGNKKKAQQQPEAAAAKKDQKDAKINDDQLELEEEEEETDKEKTPRVEFRRTVFACTILTLGLLLFRLLETIDAYSPIMDIDRSLFHASMHALAVSGLYWHSELHRL